MRGEYSPHIIHTKYNILTDKPPWGHFRDAHVMREYCMKFTWLEKKWPITV